MIALAIQFHAVPGKTGKARAKAGNVDRTVHPYGITIPCDKPSPVYNADGVRTGYTMTPLFPKEFNFPMFRRALHHVAFNLTAAMKGVEAVLEAQYDKARNYVRRPKPHEAWPFAQFVISLDQVPKEVAGALYEGPDDEFICLRMFQLAFFVGLTNPDGLKSFIATQLPAETVLIAPSYEPARIGKAGKARYRFTIVLDEEHPDAP
jgi:hypothetical protein